jgi:hypothetical protein
MINNAPLFLCFASLTKFHAKISMRLNLRQKQTLSLSVHLVSFNNIQQRYVIFIGSKRWSGLPYNWRYYYYYFFFRCYLASGQQLQIYNIIIFFFCCTFFSYFAMQVQNLLYIWRIPFEKGHLFENFGSTFSDLNQTFFEFY